MMKHALKIAMTLGLLVTGVYQYFRITGEKKAKAAEKQAQQQQKGGRGGQANQSAS